MPTPTLPRLAASDTCTQPACRCRTASAIVGLVVLAGALGVAFALTDGLRQLAFAYLLNFAFFLSLSLGALLFIMLQHVSRAGWSVVVRRVAETYAMNLWLLGVLAIPVAVAVCWGGGFLYPWTNPDHMAAEAILQNKVVYLNGPFFIGRLVLYFACWLGLATCLFRRSVAQDRTGDPALTASMERTSAWGLLVLGLTLTFASFDLLMSLDPTWTSSIFGVYYGSGGLMGFFALLIATTACLKRRGRLPEVTEEHFHDMGKWLLAMVIFWAYTAFSQYMLIWYANIPEETAWLAKRGASTRTEDFGFWTIVMLVLLIGHFVLPLLGLMSRSAKRRTCVLTAWAIWLLVMHWVDLFWLVSPEYLPGTFACGQILPLLGLSVACLVGLGALYLSCFARLAACNDLIPRRDPRLSESLALHVH